MDHYMWYLAGAREWTKHKMRRFYYGDGKDAHTTYMGEVWGAGGQNFDAGLGDGSDYGDGDGNSFRCPVSTTGYMGYVY